MADLLFLARFWLRTDINVFAGNSNALAWVFQRWHPDAVHLVYSCVGILLGKQDVGAMKPAEPNKRLEATRGNPLAPQAIR